MSVEAKSITPDALVSEVQQFKNQGYRFVTTTCVELDEKSFDLLYHFDRDLEMKHVRLTIPKGQNVPSISPVYFAALLVENEIRDQYGVCFDDIVLDFGGTLYMEENVQSTPFCRYNVVEKNAAPDK